MPNYSAPHLFLEPLADFPLVPCRPGACALASRSVAQLFAQMKRLYLFIFKRKEKTFVRVALTSLPVALARHFAGALTRRRTRTGRMPCFVGPSRGFAGGVTTTTTTTHAAGRTDARAIARGTKLLEWRGRGGTVLFIARPPPAGVTPPKVRWTSAASSLYPEEFHFPKVGRESPGRSHSSAFLGILATKVARVVKNIVCFER